MTTIGWLVELDSLYDTFLAPDCEAPRLPPCVTENGCATDDYVTPVGEVNDLERVECLRGHLHAAVARSRTGST